VSTASKGERHLWSVLNDKLEMLRASGQLEEAIRVGESALELAQRSFAPGEAELAASYEKLASLHEQKGDGATALRYLIDAHGFLEQTTPPDYGAIFQSARRLARACDETGRNEEAIGWYERAIAAAAELPDLPHEKLGTLLNNIALTFRKVGRTKSAEPYYARALQLYESALGPEHPDVAAVLNNLGVFYTNEKRFTEAEKTHLRALAIREKSFAGNHPDIAQSKCNLAVVYHSRGDYERASELYRASLAEWEAAMEKPPADYEIVASNYADLLRALGHARKAESLQARARKKRQG
jgi:tetratricopeptide (TPR) repeat protein